MGSPTLTHGQQPAAVTALVFDSVTVIDVQHGRHLLAQRVVIVGNRIQAMGDMGTVRVPAGAHIVDARGKYLIPGLWDMHTHTDRSTDAGYPFFIANGVTGIRDAGSSVPLDTLRLWRREILAGTRVGPPRQVLSGSQVNDSIGQVSSFGMISSFMGWQNKVQCDKQPFSVCVHSLADARHVVDSLKAAGSDMIKTYNLGRETYFAIAAEARRVGIQFGGHLGGRLLPWMSRGVSAIDASDSGASLVDHVVSSGGLDTLCLGRVASVERCQSLASRFRRHGTWWVPTIFAEKGVLPGQFGPLYDMYFTRLKQVASAFDEGAAVQRDWLRDSTSIQRTAGQPQPDTSAGTDDYLRVAHRAGLPIVSGTDDSRKFHWGFSLHAELAAYVAEGLTPLEALQTATLNPAECLHETDSLGTVAPGKLADLVLLDADPLKDIINTTLIRAVVANGRYFDRVALDQLLTDAKAKAKQGLP